MSESEELLELAAELQGGELASVSTVDPDEEAVNWGQALGFQLWLAIIFVFLMMTVLLYAGVQQLKEEVTPLPPREPEPVAVDLQLEKLQRALDKVEAQDRQSLELFFFAPYQDGKPVYHVGGVLSDGTLANDESGRRFKEGSAYASQHYANRVQLRREWLERVLKLAELSMESDAGFDSDPLKQPERLTNGNKIKLLQLIRERTALVEGEVRSVQQQALDSLLDFYLTHSQKIEDRDLANLLDRYGELLNNGDPKGELNPLAKQVVPAIDTYARSVFLKWGAPLLK